MARLLLGRVAQAGAVAALVATLTFFLIHLAPGDPFAMLQESMSVPPEVVDAQRALYGLDEPVGEQYLRYMSRVARGDLGWSIQHGMPVSDAIASRLPGTLILMGTALVASFALGVALGVAQAVRRGSRFDRVTRAAALLFHSLPSFWLAIVLLIVLAYRLDLFPTGQSADPLASLHPFWWRVRDRLAHLALPALTLVLLTTASIARHQRAALLDVLPEDFVRTATAKGVPARAVILRHALRNALLPVITLLGLALPALLGGTVLVEQVFSWHGMGTLLVGAIQSRDYFLLTGCVLVGSVLVVAGSLLADALSTLADPRLRQDG
ncbi:MAG TPA: ABC transporter permease [Gemmatimonadales bacterium]